MKTWISLNKKQALIILGVGLACFFWGKSQKPDIWFKSKEEYKASYQEELKMALEKQKQELSISNIKEYDKDTGKLVKETNKVKQKIESEKQDLTQNKKEEIEQKREIDLKINLPPQNALGIRLNFDFNSLLDPKWEVYGRLSQKCLFGGYCVEELSIGQKIMPKDSLIEGKATLGHEWRF